jgi:hypothetical protein
MNEHVVPPLRVIGGRTDVDGDLGRPGAHCADGPTCGATVDRTHRHRAVR